MICYKIVTKDRKSVMATRYVDGKYVQKYLVGARVRAMDHTMGFMVFPKRKDAEYFRNIHSLDNCLIIQVRVFGDCIVPNYISCGVLERSIKEFYSSIEGYELYKIIPPRGTVCYKELEAIN